MWITSRFLRFGGQVGGQALFFSLSSMITTEMKKIGISICLLFLIASPVRALQGVGALADQLAAGEEVHVVGKTAPLSEINVVNKTDDRLVVSAKIEKTGDFDFRFKLRDEKLSDLQIFAIDDFGVSNRISLQEVSEQKTVLLPPTIVNDKSDTSVTAVALTGRTYPEATVTLSISGADVVTTKVNSDSTGLWKFTSSDLKAGKYTATAVSNLQTLTSQSSQEIFFEIQPLAVPLIGKLPIITFSVWWWLPLILLILFGLWPRDLWSLVLRLIYGILYPFGWSKRRRKWGVIYDSVSKAPIVGAIVHLYKIIDGRSMLLETTITSKDGEFAFMPGLGKYLIKVAKGGFVFPSVLVKGRGSDGEYINQYHGEEFDVIDDQEVMVSIAMDRISYRANLWFYFDRYLGVAWKTLGWCLLVAGAVFSMRVWLSTSSWFDALVMAIYIGLLIWSSFNGVQAHRKTSRVIDSASGKRVPSASIAVYEATSGQLFQRRVSDPRGRFVLRLPAGHYRLVVTAVDMVAEDTEVALDVVGGGIVESKVVLRMHHK